MAAIARLGRRDQLSPPLALAHLLVPRAWLVVGIVVLGAVHIDWALAAHSSTDVGNGSVQGALNITHGDALYGKQAIHGAVDPHTDTYGPANYESYVPFASLASVHTAARLATLFFDFLTAILLFVLGRQIRGPTAGVVLAYCWLAFPFTLYEDAFAFNDALVAAGLVGTLLAARSATPRGIMAALTAWTKLTPLAALPLLAGHRRAGGRAARRNVLEFAGAFGIASLLIFVPALSHSSPSAFMTRTFGFQMSRSPSNSLWAALQIDYAYWAHAPWIATASKAAHGALAAFIGASAILLFRAPRRDDVVGLAAACAALLIGVEACLSYYSFSYIVWFAPLVLVAAILPRMATPRKPPLISRGGRGAGLCSEPSDTVYA
jgi:uncharacterized membrane protein